MKEFSFDTITDFDLHINLSIPDYGNLQDHIINISSFFIKPNGLYYDIGASTGRLLDQIIKKNNSIDFSAIGLDPSVNLADAHPNIEIVEAQNYEYSEFDFATIIFTLQFLTLENRKIILKKLYENLKDSGAIIICEKVIQSEGELQSLFEFAYYDYKQKNFSRDEILQKQKDLRYIMKPLTERENFKLFHSVGFTEIYPFWQSLAFKGWLLLK